MQLYFKIHINIILPEIILMRLCIDKLLFYFVLSLYRISLVAVLINT
jgi:hypothetical protein